MTTKSKLIKEDKIQIPNTVSYTDFEKVYLNYNLLEEEVDFCRIHEYSHIWMQHHIRGQEFIKKHTNIDLILLNVAMDYEIALHIYDDDHAKIQNRPNSLLNGTIKKEDCKKFPNCEFFEEFYFELLKEAKANKNSLDTKNADYFDKPIKPDGSEKTSPSQAIREAKEEAKKLKQQQSIQKHQQKINNYILKPSLGSEIDAVSRRRKIKRANSYRRPSRIESEFFKKGRISKQKTAKITVYVDRSGSFTPQKTAKAEKVLKKIMLKYRGSIMMDTIYFSDELFLITEKKAGGGTNHQAVIDDIVRVNSELSIIITDDDDGLSFVPDNLPRILCVPIGVHKTSIANRLGVSEVSP